MTSKSWSPYAVKYDPVAVGSIDGSDTVPHDHGIVRAINSEYIPYSDRGGNPGYTLFVGRLHQKINEEELIEVFSEYGDIKKCTLIRDIVTGHSKRYAFIEFEREHHAARAFRKAHKRIVRGAEILVDWEVGRIMKGWRPRSLGGGFGGRKESGQLRFGCREKPWAKPIVTQRNIDSR